MTLNTYNWLRQIPSSLLQKDSAPLIGFPPPFPWKQFSESLGAIFEIPISVKPLETLQWKQEQEFLSEVGDKPSILNFSVTPTGGMIHWLSAEKDIDYIMCYLINHLDQPLEVIDPEFKDSFVTFLAVEVINTLSILDFDKEIFAQILTTKELPHEPSLCQDIEITLGDRTIFSRMIISSELQQGWKKRYSERIIDPSLMSALDLTVHLEVGKIEFSDKAWSKIIPGDFLLMDSCTLKPNGEGNTLLTIRGYPIFHGKLKDGNIKLLEHPLYTDEVDMTSQDPSDHPSDSPHKDEISEDENHDKEHNLDENSDENFDEEDDVDGEDEESQNQEKWPPPPESREAQAEQEHHHAAQDVPDASQAELTVPDVELTTEEPEAEQEGFSLGGIPLNIVVEVGRIQMTIQKLMELQPGNLLELNVRPESGVDLVVNGKRIAKGELLLIGDSLGIRILEIGSKKNE